MHGWSGAGWGAGIGMGSGIFMLIFWALVIIGIVYVVRYLGRGGRAAGQETPLDILKRRYARGEVTREEFERMKGALRG
jgi:putative membrane protein